MTQVDFYILHGRSTVQDKYQFTCQLIHKVRRQNKYIYVQLPSAQAANYLDNLLWTFQPDSFIPHTIVHQPRHIPAMSSLPMPTPVYLGYHRDEAVKLDVLINLSDGILSFYQQFPRVLEVLEDEAQVKQAGRWRYKNYQAAGDTLQLHNIGHG